MVILGKWRQQSVTLSFKPNALTISLDGQEGPRVFSYDLCGRLWTAMLRQVSYRRGLNGKVVAKWIAPDGSRGRRWLEPEEANRLLSEASEIATHLLQATQTGEVLLSEKPSEHELTFLSRAAAYQADIATADAQQYHAVYKPVGILPPDQYMAVVLQLTEGCAFNTCTFCTFYRDRPFRIKKPPEFREHIASVKKFLADGLNLRRTIFLGDANALITPMPQLTALLDEVHNALDVEKLGGIYAFLDGFSGEKKSREDYAQLAHLGLKRVYIGLESGDPELLRLLKKPGHPADAISAVREMKAAGVAVGLIVLLGAGGHQFERSHVRETIRVLNEMPLDADDLIYFSELIESEGMPYVQSAFEERLQPLTSDERILQGEMIEQGLRFTEAGGTPHISRYDIREFVY